LRKNKLEYWGFSEMNLAKAVSKVGRAMGEAKFHNHMSGSMLPSGEIGAARALAIAFGISVEKVDLLLSKKQKQEFERLRKKQFREFKKMEKK
jgi:hypothetical protein